MGDGSLSRRRLSCPFGLPATSPALADPRTLVWPRTPARGRSRQGARSAAEWHVGCHARALRAQAPASAAVPAVAAALVGGWTWCASSLVAVEQVQISGVPGPEARSIEPRSRARTANEHAGRTPALPDRSRRALPGGAHGACGLEFSHRLHIRVAEQLPVAALTVASGRTAVAADGVVLGPALLSGSLPTLAGVSE